MKKNSINIALLGIGTIGTATYENIYKNRELIFQKTGIYLNVSKVLEKEPEKHQHKVHDKCIITDNFEDILQDDSIQIVVELMGGIDFARHCVIESLKKGKHVVTANKALIAEDVRNIYDTVASSMASFFFEGAVAGGIPVIAILKKSFSSNQITKIQSIVNGTCNYILTDMAENQIDFPASLEKAMEKGYAEADPSFDIEGIDAAHKISILTGLAFRTIVDFKKLDKVEGITKVSILDIKRAKELGYEIKLIASTEKIGETLDIRVEPCLINKHHPLASVEGVYNAIFTEGFPVGKSMFYGLGAGGNPTSSAVISDIITCSVESVIGGLKHSLFYETMQDNTEISRYGNPSCFYIRIRAEDRPGVLAKIAGILAKYNISIASVFQKTTGNLEHVPVFLTTHMANERDMIKATFEINELKEQTGLKEAPFIMRIID